MADHGIDVQKFYVTNSSSEVDPLVKKLSQIQLYSYHTSLYGLYITDCEEIVIKAQILAGGRGKGEFTSGLTGGVQVTKR